VARVAVDRVALLEELKSNLNRLKFSEPLEELFRRYYFRRTIGQVRVAVLSGIILYASFGVLDAVIAPKSKEILWLIRYAVICPAGIIFLLATFRLTDRDELALQRIHSLAVVVAGFGLLGMMMVVPQNKAFLYYAGVMLVIFYTYALSAMRFYHALAGGLFLSLALPLIGFYILSIDTQHRFLVMYYLASTNIVGIPVSYMLERHIRKDFLMALLLIGEMNETARLNAVLRNLSYMDALTGIYNRRKFEEFLKEEWEKAKRMKRPIALLMIDIDRFKSYNDLLGHSMGDECIKKVADAISSNTRKDVDLPARYGGEEFVVVLPGTGVREAGEIAERIRRDVESLGVRHPLGGSVTVSIGVASAVPGILSEARSLVDMADRALYRAKRKGRNRVEAYVSESLTLYS